MLSNSCRILSAVALAAFLGTAHAQSEDKAIKLNQIQVIGTHNSYHAGIAANESKLWQDKYADAFKGLGLPAPASDAAVR